MGVGGKCDGVDLRHINFPIHHNALIGSDIDHLADDAASVFIILILDEPALQAERKFVDDRGIYCFCFADGQTAAGKFIGNFIAGLYAEIVCFHYVGCIGNADGECSPSLDLAEKLGIPVQDSVRSAGSTNGAAIHLTEKAVPVIVIGVPVRYAHTHYGISAYADFDNAVKLACEILKRLDEEQIMSF